MNKLMNILGLSVCLFWFTACESSDAPVNGYIATTEENSTSLVLKGYEGGNSGFNVFEPEGFDKPFYIGEQKFVGNAYDFEKSTASRLDAMGDVPTDEGWQSDIAIENGSTYWVRYTSLAAYKYVKVRVAYIDGNNVGIEYRVAKEESRPNSNANTGYEKVSVTNFEMPHLNADNYYVDHYITFDGAERLNYALEWNEAKKHSAWVAYSFDAVSSKVAVSRTDAWAVDPELPANMQTTSSDHQSDGFDRGHLCASYDRVYSEAANEQTFYYSNMSPQIASFNQGFWASFEGLVQDWARSNKYDKIYIAKGGTLDQLLIDYMDSSNNQWTNDQGFTKHGLACPKYYFMAILSEKSGVYRAIGFWMEHRDDYGYSNGHYASSETMEAYAVSIDELEQDTGLDFFCNLPDDVENQVESTYNASDWAW